MRTKLKIVETDIRDIPVEFMNKHIPPGQKQLIKIKYDIYNFVISNNVTKYTRTITDRICDNYHVGKVRAKELLMEARLDARLK